MTDYNLANIRTLLTEGFSDAELRRFCYDTPEFRSVHHELAQYSGKAEIVDRLIEYAERKNLFGPLLAWAAGQNPARYQMYLSMQGDSPGTSGVSKRVDKPAGRDAGGAGSSVKIGDVGGNIEGSTIAGRDVNIYHQGQATPPSQVTSAPEKEQPPFWRQPTVWWASIVVTLITLAGMFIPSLLNGSPPPSTSFDYQVRVQAKDSGEDIAGAQVTIEVGGQSPLNVITDSEGVARISVQDNYAGKPGVVLVEATGYKSYRLNIDLVKDALPQVVQLEQKS